MSNCLKSLTLKDRYSTNRDDLIGDFYEPCLERSLQYDRAVGYFRSSMFLLAVRPVSKFALHNGKIRLVCSPELSSEDIDALAKGYEWRDRVGSILENVIDEAMKDPLGAPMVEFLATLVAIGCLDVRIAFRPTEAGIFHDKLGIFKDDDEHSVSFTGSSNETFQAWDSRGNHESFDAFCSWTTDERRVVRHSDYFERLWQGEEPGVQTIHFPDVARDRLVAVANPEGPAAAFEKLMKSRARLGMVPQEHQVAAIETWRERGYRGILEHATGSGKTLTALLGIREWIGDGSPALVFVPSHLLLLHWYAAIKSELDDLAPRILLVGGDYDGWRKEHVVEGYTRKEGSPRITIAMIQTASSESFLGRVVSGPHLLVVGDEVHRLGSRMFSRVFSIGAGARLGLSATPKRYGDPIGTTQILTYFGAILEPPFTLSDAIRSGRLCRYNYYIHPTELSSEEASNWREQTIEIKRLIARSAQPDNEPLEIPDYVKFLLIKRARILKGAASKVGLALSVLRTHYEHGQRWLVYCDDQAQLGDVLSTLQQGGLPANEYHSAMVGDRSSTFDYFSSRGGVLVAIRCLDEGVDIPSVDHALILASSRNPREFIQRRGRVLRVAPGKYFADIHDALVQPPIGDQEPDDIAILRGEIARALHFAQSAANDAVKFQLRQLARDANIDPDGLVLEAGFELDDGETD